MRENAGSWIVKILLGIIVIVFVLWGIRSGDPKKSPNVATVNGEVVSVDEYRTAYQNMIAQMRQQFGANLSDEMIEMLQIEKQALNRLIDKKLLLQESRKLKIDVSEKELADAVKNSPMFQNEGVFDFNIYQAVLKNNNLTPEMYERMQQESLTIEKLRSILTDNVKVSENEISEWHAWQNSVVDINYVVFSPERQPDIAPSDEEMNKYYKENGEKYKTPPKIKASYVQFDTDVYLSKAEVTPEEIKTYYDENNQMFETPKTVSASHILIKVPVEGGGSLEADKKKIILDVLAQLKQGKDFSELAKTYSEDPGKENGGKLGFFKHEDMVKPFADKAFSMKPGEISDPVRTQFGWHIIKVDDVKEASKKSLEEATVAIVETLKKRKAKTLAFNDAETVYEATVNGDDLSLAAESVSAKIITTSFFSQKDAIPGVPDSAKFSQVAFSLPIMETSDVVEFETGYAIIRADEKIEPAIPELKEVVEKVKGDLTAKMKQEAALADAKQFLKAVKEGASFSDESQKKGYTVKSTGPFKRQDAIPDIGFEKEIGQAAFTLSKPGEAGGEVLKGKENYYVISLKERKTPDKASLETERGEIEDLLLRKKESALFEKWIAQVKNESKIDIKQGFFD